MVETFIMEAPICKTVNCKRPLTWLKESNCWRCLVCNPIPKNVRTEKPESRYVDVKPDEKRVREMIKESFSEEKIREIVQDELANWHVQVPPVSRTDVEEMIKTYYRPKVEKPETWRQRAKRLGVEMHNRDENGKPMGMRKKEDVMADIEAKEDETVQEELRAEEP